MSENVLVKANFEDNVTPKLEKLKKGMAETSTTSNLVSKAFEDITTKAEGMGIPVSKIEGYFGGISKTTLGVVGAFGAVGVGLGALALKTASYGAHLEDLRDQTGLSVEQISSMRNVLELGGVTTETYAKALGKLSIKIGENSEQFRKMGVDVSSPEKAFDSLKHKIASIEDPLQRAKLANDLLGKSYQEMMPLLLMGNEEYDKVRGSTTIFSAEFAEQAAKVDDSVAMLKNKFSDFATALGANFLPMMEKLVGLLSDAADFWAGPSDSQKKEQKKADDLEAIRQKFAEKQAESDKGARAIGLDKASDVQIDGKTFSQTVKAYMESVRAETKASEAAAKAKQDSLAAQQKASKAAEDLAKEQERIANLYKQTSYATFLQSKQEQDFRDTRAIENQGRFDATFGQSVDAFGGNDTAFRDAQEARNTQSQHAFGRQRFQEHQLDLAEQDKESKRVADLVAAQAFQELLDKQNEELEKQNKELEKQVGIIKRIESGWSSLTQGPLEEFYKHVGSANKSLGSNFSALFSNIQDKFGEMLASMAAEWTEKAAMFGALKLVSASSGGALTGAIGKFLDGFSWFANGSEYAYGGITRVGERGPENIILPRGSKVVPSGETTSNTTYNVYITNNETNPTAIIREIKSNERRNLGR